MAIYTVGRRQVIVALLLTAALLLALDLRGNPVLDTLRDGFSRAMNPVERAADVVAQPTRRAWDAYSNYDELERENQELQETIDRQAGTQATAEAAIIDYQFLLALNNLPSLANIETEKAQVVGGASNNIDQVVEINKGSNQGIAVGMPVVNQAGLIGRITQVNASTSLIMLITDPRFAVAVEILGGSSDGSDEETPVATTPSGRTDEENIDESTPTSTTPLDVFDDRVLPQADPNAPDGPIASSTTIAAGEDTELDVPVAVDPIGDPVPPPTTTTTIPAVLVPVQLQKEFGTIVGRGDGRPAQVQFLQDSPSLAVLEVGDLVETSGGSKSFAPPNIPVGRVINRADRAGAAGPLLEVELIADLDKLNFVRVVLFRPLSEVDE